MTRLSTCSWCYHWRRGAPSQTDLPAPENSDHHLGVCEAVPPVVMIRQGMQITSLQPVTHATRSCVDFIPIDGDAPDPGGGETIDLNSFRARRAAASEAA